MADDFDYDNLAQLVDLNGSAYVIANVGEIEENLTELYTWLPPLECQPAGLTFPFNQCMERADDALKAQLNRYLNKVYWMNFIMLQQNADKFRGQAQAAAAVAYLRMLLVREGLANPDADPEANFCQYNLCSRLTGPEERIIGTDTWYNTVRTAALAAFGPNPTLAQFRTLYSGGLGTARDGVHPIAYRAKPTLLPADMALLRKQFCDIICLTAFMFRTRGHHWTQDMDPTFRRLWRGCLNSEGRDTPLCDWESCARYVLKAPFPLQLDNFWGDAIAHNYCSAKLAIRWDAPSAGTASVVALRRGLDDLKAAFPVLEEKFATQITALQEQEEIVANNRWSTSINAKYYGVNKERIDERGLAPLAATIIAALSQFNERAPLLRSKALERLASSAPIVGAVAAAILEKVATHDTVVYSYLPRDVRQVAFR